MANALGIAYSQASGNRQCIPDAALSKRLQAGFGARDGITAVRLAQAGLTGASNAFEGRDGFFNLYQRGEYNRDTVLNSLGEELMSKQISHKPYPCGRNLHALLDAALDVRAQGGGEGISAIEVQLPGQAASRANMAFPTQVVEAQFSVPFAVALALATSAADVASFDQPQDVPQSVRDLFGKVTIEPSESLSGFGAAVSAMYENGGVVRSEVHVAKGNPEKPLTPEDVSRKFADCNRFAGQPLAEGTIGRIIDLVLSRPLTELESTNDITSALAIS
jgi:2-methylcitrate dehydratase PrpD